MLRRLTALLCSLSLLAPSLASAAGSRVMLSDLFAIMERNTRPVVLSLGVSGMADDAEGELTIAGWHNGKTLLRDAAGEFTVSLFLNDPNQGSIRGTLEGKLTKSTIYMRMTALDLSGDLAEMQAVVEPYVGQWISFPIEPEEYDKMVRSSREQQLRNIRRWNQYFTITQVTEGTVTRYAITIPSAKQRRLLMALSGVVRQYNVKALTEARRFLRTTTITLDATVEAEDPGNMFRSAESRFDLKSVVEGKTLEFHISGASQVLGSARTVQAPATSNTWEEIQKGLESLDD